MTPERLEYLRTHGLVISFDDAAANPPRYIVVTGFGFGREYWAVDDENYEYDAPRYNSKYIKHGKCIEVGDRKEIVRTIRQDFRSVVLYEVVD